MLPKHFYRILLKHECPTKSLQDHSSLLITYLLPLPIIFSVSCLLSGLLIPPTGEPSSGFIPPVSLPAQKNEVNVEDKHYKFRIPLTLPVKPIQ